MDFGKIGDFFTGGGEYADPNNVDPVYGVPRGMVRDAQWNTIGNVSATLLAAGMRMTPAQRAQILMQGLSNAGSRQTTDMYNAQLMRAKGDEIRQQAEDRKRQAQVLETIRANPQAYGLTPDQARLLGPSNVADIVKRQIDDEQYQFVKMDDGRIAAINKRDPSKVVYSGQASGPEWGPLEEVDVGGKKVSRQRNLKTNEYRQIGGSGVSVNVGGDGGADEEVRKALAKKEGETLASYQKAGMVAGSAIQDLAAMQELLEVAPQGPLQGRLAQRFPGFSDSAAVLQSYVQRIAPTLRVEGSGATSDVEFQGMLASLPQLQNSPAANRAILEAMRAKAELNIERAKVVMLAQNGKIKLDEARERLFELDSRSVLPEPLRAALSQIKGDAGGKPVGGGVLTPGANGVMEWRPN